MTTAAQNCHEHFLGHGGVAKWHTRSGVEMGEAVRSLGLGLAGPQKSQVILWKPFPSWPHCLHL